MNLNCKTSFNQTKIFLRSCNLTLTCFDWNFSHIQKRQPTCFMTCLYELMVSRTSDEPSNLTDFGLAGLASCHPMVFAGENLMYGIAWMSPHHGWWCSCLASWFVWPPWSNVWICCSAIRWFLCWPSPWYGFVFCSGLIWLILDLPVLLFIFMILWVILLFPFHIIFWVDFFLC